jgi:type II secretory pathway pseudopilin PulG
VAPSDSSARSARRAAPAGLTITELLIYLILGGVLAAAAAGLVISNVRTSRNLELRQRAVDFYGRINHLLQLEISEGRTISYNQPLPNGCGPGTSLFSVRLLDVQPPDPTREIHYYTTNGNDLRRCGPAVQANGSVFDPATDQILPLFDALVDTNTRLELTNNTDPRAVSYTLTLLGPDAEQVVFQAGSAGQPLIARTGVHQIKLVD